MRSNRFVRGAAFAISLLLLSFQSAFGQTEITKNKEQFMSTLASMPYTSTGSGPVLYVLEYSDCPDCRAFESDLKARPGTKAEIRRIFYAISEKTANEAAYLAQTKDINDFYAFMNGTKAAPAFRNNRTATDALNSVVGPLKNVIRPAMSLNGWPFKTPVHPHFLWETNGRAYMTGGYTKESLTEILSMVSSATQVAQASVPPRSQPGDLAKTSNTATAATGPTGPDVIGLRIGMTPAEARAIFKAREFGLTKKRNEFLQEHSTSLAFRFPGSTAIGLEGVTFFDAIRGNKVDSDGNPGRDFDPQNLDTNQLEALFTPTPGQETVFKVTRSVLISQSKRPTFDAFKKTLIEKYGTPTYWDPKNPGAFHWSYDGNGAQRKADSKTNWAGCPRENAMDENAYVQQENLRKFKGEAAGCGAIVLSVQLAFQGALYRGEETPISNYTARLFGYDLIVHGIDVVTAMREKAKVGIVESQRKQGQQQKPVL